MSNDIKKKQVDELLEAIKNASYFAIDMGASQDASYIVMDLALTAYEFEMMKEYSKWIVKPEESASNVIQFNPNKER